eukprot:g2496.t1
MLAGGQAALQKVLERWQQKKGTAVEWLTKELGCNVVKEPVGVVGCITPWNYPLNQIAAKVFPALLVGCTVVLKPSEVTPVCAYLLAEAIHEAEVPPGVFNMIMGDGPNCGEVLAAHEDVDLVSFTGSTRAGTDSLVAAKTLKVVRTELGGKSAALLLEDRPRACSAEILEAAPSSWTPPAQDADFQALIPKFVKSLMANTGQSCNALSRLLVPRTRYEEAVGIAKKVAEATIVGESADSKASIGPVVSQAQWDRVQGYIQTGIKERSC